MMVNRTTILLTKNGSVKDSTLESNYKSGARRERGGGGAAGDWSPPKIEHLNF